MLEYGKLVMELGFGNLFERSANNFITLLL